MTTLSESAGGDEVLGQRRCKSDVVYLHLHLVAINDDHSDSTTAVDVSDAVVTELDQSVVYEDEIL